MKIHFFKNKVTKRASNVTLPWKNRVLFKNLRRVSLCGTYSNVVFFHHPRDSPNKLSNYTKNLQENKTDGFEPNDGLSVDDMEKIEKTNNLILIVFAMIEEKTLTQIYASKNMNENGDNIENKENEIF